MIARAALSAAALAVLLGPPSPAAAQAGVTLVVRPPVPAYGARVTFAGTVAPPGVQGVSVTLDGRPVAGGSTHADGTYSLTAVARRPGTLVATAQGASSGPVRLWIRPRLSARVAGPAVLGAPLAVEGTLRPARAGRMLVTTGGRTRAVPVGRDGRFRAALATARAGRVCARLRLAPAAGFAAVRRRRCAVVGTPSLGVGAQGPAVRFLQTRLARLRYLLLGVDGRYGADTRDAVYAFQKVERLGRDGIAGPAVWRRLAGARTPAPAVGGTHLEVDKARQVLLEVRGGRVRGVAHISTGVTGNTPVGTWRIYAKTPGFNALGMYDSMYFLRGFAVHGYASVPPYPASHGCVRVPLWLAPGLYARWPVGSAVVVLPG